MNWHILFVVLFLLSAVYVCLLWTYVEPTGVCLYWEIVDCMRGWNLSLKQPFSFHLLLSYYSALLNLLIHLFVVLFITASCLCYLPCHKTPVTDVRLLKRCRTQYVPVLRLQQVSLPVWESYLRAQLYLYFLSSLKSDRCRNMTIKCVNILNVIK